MCSGVLVRENYNIKTLQHNRSQLEEQGTRNKELRSEKSNSTPVRQHANTPTRFAQKMSPFAVSPYFP